jgi:UDP-perosamine 4-acetyltransferase
VTPHVIRVPRVNANDETVRFVAWLAREWEQVWRGQPIATIETTKAVVELEADADGLLVPAAEPGDVVPLGDPVGFLLSHRDDAAAMRLRAARYKADAGQTPLDRQVSQKARALLAQHAMHPEDVPGTGPIREKDVAAVIEARRGSALTAEEQRDVVAGLDVAAGAVALFGAALQAEVVLDCIVGGASRLRPVILVDDRPRVRALGGVPVVSSAHLGAIRQKGVKHAHVCVGDGTRKLRVGARLEEAGFEIVNVAHPTAVVSPSAILGRGTFLGPLVLVGPHVTIGEYAQMNNAATVAHHSIVGKGSRISDGAHLGGRVTVGDRVFIGIGVSINADVTIGSDTTIVSGASVYGDVPRDSTVRIDGRAYPRGEESRP